MGEAVRKLRTFAPPAAEPVQRRLALFADVIPAEPIADRPAGLPNLRWAGVQLRRAIAVLAAVAAAWWVLWR